MGGVGFRRSHRDRHIDHDLLGTANNPSEFFSGNRDGLNNKFGDTIGFEARVIKCGVILRHQEWFVHLACLVEIAKVDSGKRLSVAFTAESNPTTVAGEAMPGFALAAVDIEPAVLIAAGFLGGFEVNQVQIAAWLMDGPRATIAHAE